MPIYSESDLVVPAAVIIAAHEKGISLLDRAGKRRAVMARNE
jgi:hypothetical protein